MTTERDETTGVTRVQVVSVACAPVKRARLRVPLKFQTLTRKTAPSCLLVEIDKRQNYRFRAKFSFIKVLICVRLIYQNETGTGIFLS